MVTSVYQYDTYVQVTFGSTEHTDFYGDNAESYNPNTGLEYLRARYYNANKGRFFQEDAYLGDITDSLTLNRYAYVKNSPLNYTDPSGNRPIWGEGKTTRQITAYANDSLKLANPSNATKVNDPNAKRVSLVSEMKRAAEASGVANLCEVTADQVNDFFHEINWKQVMSGLGVAVAGVIVTAIAGTILAGVAALVIPAITLLLSGTTVIAALITLGTAIAALIAAMMGISDVLEGLQDVSNGVANNGEKGINLIRDTLFAENPDDYYVIEFMATMGAAEGARTINQFGLDQQIYNNYQAMQEDEKFPDMAHWDNPNKKSLYDVDGNYTGGRSKSELDALEYDPAKKAVTPGSKNEAKIGLDLEQKGVIGRLERSSDPKSEFIDSLTGKKYDVKSFESTPIGADGNPITSPKKGAFKVENAMKNIMKEFTKNGNDFVIIDKSKLTQDHINELINAINEAGIADKIIWWPR